MTPTRSALGCRDRGGRAGEDLGCRVADHASGDGGVVDCVDEDEAAGDAIVGVAVHGERLDGFDLNQADAVERESRCGLSLERGYVETVLNVGDLSLDGSAGVFEQVAASEVERLFVHPDQRGHEARRGDGWRFRRDEKITPADVEFICNGDSYRLRGVGFIEIAVEGNDPVDAAGAARWQYHDWVAGPDRSSGNLSSEAAKILVRT